MKKSLAIIIMSVYGILSVGIHMNLHYCCGKISDIHFFQYNSDKSEDKKDNVCTIEKSCCRFEDVSLRIDQSHQATSFKTPVLQAIESPRIFTDILLPESKETKSISTFDINGPPPNERLFLRHHSLVLYA